MVNTIGRDIPRDVPQDFVNALKDNYLGSPIVVEKIIAQYAAEMHEWFMARGAGVMTAKKMQAKVLERSLEFAAIFSGEDKNYIPVPGYNSRVTGLNAKIRVDLGHYWQQERAKFDDDPYRVLYDWLLWAVYDSLTKYDDEELNLIELSDTLQSLVRMLTGTDKRQHS